jgi:hypothetical protein
MGTGTGAAGVVGAGEAARDVVVLNAGEAIGVRVYVVTIAFFVFELSERTLWD